MDIFKDYEQAQKWFFKCQEFTGDCEKISRYTKIAYDKVVAIKRRYFLDTNVADFNVCNTWYRLMNCSFDNEDLIWLTKESMK